VSLEENVGFVSVGVEDAEIQQGDLLDFEHRKLGAADVAGDPVALNESLEGTDSGEVRAFLLRGRKPAVWDLSHGGRRDAVDPFRVKKVGGDFPEAKFSGIKANTRSHALSFVESSAGFYGIVYPSNVAGKSPGVPFVHQKVCGAALARWFLVDWLENSHDVPAAVSHRIDSRGPQAVLEGRNVATQAFVDLR
jgi:hypothetical protein